MRNNGIFYVKIFMELFFQKIYFKPKTIWLWQTIQFQNQIMWLLKLKNQIIMNFHTFNGNWKRPTQKLLVFSLPE